ncbi:MAG: acyl-CoA dehydrogenase family protein, partial [Pseudomonadota bacterium]
FSDVKVPLSNLIGAEGEGVREANEYFSRIYIMFAAMGVGIARAALDEGISYSKKRHAFDVPISSFKGIQAKLLEMATLIRAARNLYYEAACSLEKGNTDSALSAMAKRFAGEMAVKCADEALQIHGGYGYFGEYRVQRLYRDAKVVQLWEGTKELEKANILKTLLR